jgi:hypothetical protein
LRVVALDLLFIFIALLFCGSFARAYEVADQWSSVRAEGMGGAYTSVVNDGDALFYNPAGLAGQTRFEWELFDPRAGANGIDNLKTLQDVVSGGTSNLASSLQQLYGKRVWLQAGTKSAILIPGFAMGAFVNSQAGIYVANPANTTMNLNYFFDYGFAAGGGFELIPSFMKFGLSARRFNRTGTSLPIGAATLANLDTDALQNELKRRGTGYAADLGATFTLPGPVSPSLSVVYRNAGMTSFTHEEGAGAPPPIDPELVIGGAMKISGGLVDITPALDFRYANRSDIDVGKKMHIGCEVALPLLSLRAGLNQGYYTAGVGLNLGLIQLDAATYGVELGAYPGQQEDRRYVAQLRIQLGFDPGSFGLGGSGSRVDSNGDPIRQSHLKQRR